MYRVETPMSDAPKSAFELAMEKLKKKTSNPASRPKC